MIFKQIKPASLALIALVIIMMSFGQTMAKLGALQFNTSGQEAPYTAYLLVAGAYSMMMLRSLIWIKVLKETPLSVAYPMLSLSFIFILLISSLVFSESITNNKIYGALCIITGIIVLGSGRHDK